HILLIALLFMTAYYNSMQAIYYAILCGFLYELIYVEIIGGYVLAYPLIVYLFSLVLKILQPNIFIVSFFSLVAVILVEYYGYIFASITQGIHMTNHDFFFHRLCPTLLLNIILLILF